MKCKSCGVSTSEKMLHRTSPLGTTPANWMCIDCISKEEPELVNNIKSDDYQVLKDIEEVVINTKRNEL